MSRLIVKNLPSYVTPARLQEYFEGKKSGGPGGTLTDVKVALKPDGTSRRFGFVGYKTEKEAAAAKEWFDKTFIDSTRINVSIVEGAKDAPMPRPNKRPRLGPSPLEQSSHVDHSAASKKSKHNDKTSEASKSRASSQLDEFMQLQTKKGPSWANEALVQPDLDTSPAGVQPTKFKSNNKTEKEEESEPEKDKREEAMSDLDWMKQRMSQNVNLANVVPEKVFEQSDDEAEAPRQETPEPPEDLTKETILQTSRLFLRNLTFSCTDADLLELCRPFGEVSQVHVPLDSLSKQSKGVAYVTFTEPTSAFAAYEALDQKSFQGRLLHILAAVDRKGKIQVEEGKKQSLKSERETKRKAMAGKEFNWSMLYMNSDAVVSSIADRMSISKADILNPDSDNAAVKLALAETHVIQETKTYLESHGVLLSSFSARVRRSDTIILVKNIPYGTTAEQIREMFEVHGELTKVLVPPAGTMAVVEFVHADEAAKAFRAIAYRRLGNAVVYLEKGPLGMFEESFEGENSGTKITTGSKPVTISEQDEGDGEDEPALSAGSTLFVKNLSFATTSERLTQMFRHFPSFSFARVQMKPDPKRPGPDAPRLSMGYGFIGFKTAEGAKKAIKSMQGFVLDGHSLHVKFAGRGREEESKVEMISKSKTTKMIVKNVPFEATKKDIRELFSAHGQLKSVRVPKKFNSQSRGFAFLEFVTRHEAENAYAALRHTHLLGRHLVLEWAEEAEQDLDVLRAKAGVGFGEGAEIPGKKRKLEIVVDGHGEDNDMS